MCFYIESELLICDKCPVCFRVLGCRCRINYLIDASGTVQPVLLFIVDHVSHLIYANMLYMKVFFVGLLSWVKTNCNGKTFSLVIQ